MNVERYFLDLSGRPLEGYKADEVAESLARLLRVSPQKARNMIRGAPSRIQRDLDKERAVHLMNKVIACGAQCEITAVPAEDSTEAETADSNDEQPSMLDLELEVIEEGNPPPPESDNKPIETEQEKAARARAFQRLTKEAFAVKSDAAPDEVSIADEQASAAEESKFSEVEISAGEADGGSRRLPLIAAALVAVLVAGVAGWLLLSGSDTPEVAKRSSPELSSKPVESSQQRTQKRMKLLARSVRIWMIQYGAGFDPAQVTMQRMQQDLNIEPMELQDGWGTPFRYQPKGDQFSITSAGPDKVFDSEDDKSITEKAQE